MMAVKRYMEKSSRGWRSRSGRPKKFDEPSRPVTLTLPERVLADLPLIHKDRAKAIAEACRQTLRLKTHPITVEVIKVGPGRGLIVVGDSRYLGQQECFNLVEIAPGRNLISVKTGTPCTTLEVCLSDLLDIIPPKEERERKLVAQLVALLRQTRQMKALHKEEILIIPHDYVVTES
jgi:hypothetical protein